MGIIMLTSILAVAVLIGQVSSDLAEDTRECQDQLIGLTPCLNYASGDVKTPAPSCCIELREKYKTTERCLCLLVKDRNEPGLGFKINATLALSLPYICHAPGANISRCPELLHLAPGSPDAQVFLDFIRNLNATAMEPINGDVGSGGSSSTSTTPPPKSSSTRPSMTMKGRIRWAAPAGINVSSLLLCLLVISVFI